jgi:AraC-like DNA-binding protein
VADQSTPALSPERQALAQILREQIIPIIAEHGQQRLVLGRQTVSRKDLPAEVGLARIGPPGRATRKRGRDSIVLTRWPDDGMEALRFPGICFVTEGEADIRIGDAVLHCPAGYGILFPAGVPRSAGHRAHWLRPHPEKAHSDIVWVNFNSSGATCHRCQTRGVKHLSDYGWYSVIIDRRLLTLTEYLADELEQKSQSFEPVGNAYLTAIFNLLLRHMSSAPAPARPGRVSPGNLEHGVAPRPEVVLSRAQSYIENHLSYHMTLQDIAHAAYVSRARLAQIFREQLAQTVWEYVTQRRLEEAKTMLAQTDLYIYRIAYLAGFASPTTFAARFKEIVGMSPAEYRRQAKATP